MLDYRAAQVEIARCSLADFAQQAVAAGVVDGTRRLDWGPHLDALCDALQFQLEGWIVANGPGADEPEEERERWLRKHQAMIARQAACWEATGATWEDGEPEPWFRYVLAQNVIWNVPPSTWKSTLAMVIANAWIWLWCPTYSFGAASGMDSNVDRDAKATRDLVRSRWYRETFSITWEMEALDDDGTRAAREAARLADADLGVKRDTDAVSDWATTAGGKRRSRTINAGFTGTHVDGFALDDPDDADKVWGEADRLRPQNRYTRAIENRVNSELRCIRLVLQQRVHVEDFTAYLLSRKRWSPHNPKGWIWVCIPAEYGRGPKDAPAVAPWGRIEWRTEPGQLIHPHITAGVLADKLQAGGGETLRDSQYNQNPQRVVAGILKRHHARFFVFEGEDPALLPERPEGCPRRAVMPPVVVKREQLTKRTLSVDANNTLEIKPGSKPSAVGLTVDAMIGGKTLVLDDRTLVTDVSGTYQAIYAAMAVWDLDEILVELKAAGPGVVTELRAAIRRGWYLDPKTDQRVPLLGPSGRPACPEIHLANPKEGKAARNQGLVAPWERGDILLHDGAPWLYAQVDTSRKTLDDGFIGEVCSWPGSQRGDRMDSLSQYVARHRVVVTAKASASPIVLTRAG